jgi:hypothetical protein
VGGWVPSEGLRLSLSPRKHNINSIFIVGMGLAVPPDHG